MSASPFVSRTGTTLLSLLSLISAQSVPGGQLLAGGGAPGSAPYELVDLYDGSDNFFDKFNYYSVSPDGASGQARLLTRRRDTIRHMDTCSKKSTTKRAHRALLTRSDMSMKPSPSRMATSRLPRREPLS